MLYGVLYKERTVHRIRLHFSFPLFLKNRMQQIYLPEGIGIIAVKAEEHFVHQWANKRGTQINVVDPESKSKTFHADFHALD